jgi:hypothetical protein
MMARLRSAVFDEEEVVLQFDVTSEEATWREPVWKGANGLVMKM